jgi:putative transposase
MARLARAIVPGLPLHITQRGNRRQRTFFCTEDYLLYTALMAEYCRQYGVEIWAYCLMTNHTHLIAVPETAEGLCRAIGEAHRRYTLEVNEREGWRGYLWQGRFSSYVMDERYTLAAARYIELNPVRAAMVERPQDYPWSSAQAHIAGRDDGLVKVQPLLASNGDWAAFLGEGMQHDDSNLLRKHQTTGRPLGSDAFVDELERILGRALRPLKRGRKATEA